MGGPCPREQSRFFKSCTNVSIVHARVSLRVYTEVAAGTGRVQKMLSFAPHLIRTRLMRRPEQESDEESDGEGSVVTLDTMSSLKRPEGIERWSDSTSRIVLIGESAHPWQVRVLLSDFVS